MNKTDDSIICELNILKNRLEAGESIIQCLSTMGIPLAGTREFLEKWNKLSHLMIEGRILPADAVAEFVSQLEDANQLLSLVQQKTLSPRIQAFISMSVIALLSLSSLFLFPENLKPSFTILGFSLALSATSALIMQKLLKNFLKDLCFLEWISFLRSLSLSLQCGMTLPSAIAENAPAASTLKQWPRPLSAKLCYEHLERDEEKTEKLNNNFSNKLWTLADRSWNSACRNYREGLPQVDLIKKLSKLQENEFKHWMNVRSEKLTYLLLLPLFTLSVPAVLILLFAPLLSALM